MSQLINKQLIKNYMFPQRLNKTAVFYKQMGLKDWRACNVYIGWIQM